MRKKAALLLVMVVTLFAASTAEGQWIRAFGGQSLSTKAQ